MRFRKTLTFFILATGLALALSAWAQQKPVAPGFSPAKPLTQDQVQSLVRSGLGDETGAKAIEQRGIDFAPSEDFYQTLKVAGASEAFLKALRAAKPPEPASAKKPLDQVQVILLLADQVPSHRVAMLVNERGIDFDPTDPYFQEVRLAGGEDELISTLKNAKVTKPVTVDPALQARQTEVREHLARAGEFLRGKRDADAEAELRGAILLAPEEPELHVGLGEILGGKRDWEGSIAEYREALRLNPNLEEAHYNLGVDLGHKGDLDGAIAEYRETLRLNSNDDDAHVNLGIALGNKGDWDGEIVEEREALRLNPNKESAHYSLGTALGNKGDWDGKIAEEREALRLNPNDDKAHISLGNALGSKGDWDGAIAEEREALRLNPNSDLAHVGLGLSFGAKGDWDGMLAEERAALRLNPSNADAHNLLGFALEQRGDWAAALEEYRSAYMLNPRKPPYKQNYERLLRKENK